MVRRGVIRCFSELGPDSGCPLQDPRAANGAVSILDGDTIEVLHQTRSERIRLNGIYSIVKIAGN